MTPSCPASTKTPPKGEAIAVCYLLRAGNPEYLFRAFLSSLHRHPAGLTYQPILIQKGFSPGFTHPLSNLWSTAAGARPEIISLSDDGYDLTAYRKAANLVDASSLLFFNSYSRVLADGWLQKMNAAHAMLGEHSMIGATGSWESTGAETPFPNPAIRTNAFLIKRAIFLSFAQALDTRRDCTRFEAGPANMSRQILEAGGQIAIANRNGDLIFPEQWPESRVFRSGNQELLLVADNRTLDYQCASLRRRAHLANLAFGERATIYSQPPWTRWRARLAWRLDQHP